jgi:hypothetical protein
MNAQMNKMNGWNERMDGWMGGWVGGWMESVKSTGQKNTAVTGQ